MRFIREHFVFVSVLLVCALLRFIPVFDYQFTFDELSGLDRTQFSSFAELIEKGVKVDAHPALVQLIIYYLSGWFGYETWIIKLPFLLFSLGAVVYAYRFGNDFFSRQAGLFASSLFSFSLIFVFYAPIARMYIAGVFFSVALLYHFFRIFFRPSSSLNQFFFFGLFCLLSALNQHLNALFALTVAVSGLVLLRKDLVTKYLITCLLTALLYLPQLPVTLYQLSIPGIGRDAGGWLEAPHWTVLFDFLRILFGTGFGYLAFSVLFLLSLSRLNRPITMKGPLLLITLFIVNFLVIFLYSVFRSPVYQHSALLFSSVALVLGLTAFVNFIDNRIFYFTFSLYAGFLLFNTYIIKDYFTQCPRTVYEYQFQRTAFYQEKFGKEKVQALFFDCDTLMKKIYFQKYARFPIRIGSDTIISYGENKKFMVGDREVSSLRLFGEYVESLKAPYIALSSSTPLYEMVVRNSYPYIIENTQTQGIYYQLYSKFPVAATASAETTLGNSSPIDLPIRKDDFPMALDAVSEFPFEAPLTNIKVKEGNIILAELKLSDENEKTEELEICFALRDTVSNETVAYSAKERKDFTGPDGMMYSEFFIGTASQQLGASGKLSCYLWNKGHATARLLDFRIRIVDYWHQKWNFWK